MIPSLFLRRALQADAIFSGVGAVIFTLGAGELAPLFDLPEALLLETGLFLIVYAAFVGWLGTRQSFPRILAGIVGVAWTGPRNPDRRGDLSEVQRVETPA